MKEALGALLVGLVLGVSVPWLSGRTVFKAQPSEKDQPRKPVERRTNGAQVLLSEELKSQLGFPE